MSGKKRRLIAPGTKGPGAVQTAPVKPHKPFTTACFQTVGAVGNVRVLEWTHGTQVRHVCTSREPWKVGSHGAFAVHPDAAPTGEVHPGSVWFVCPHCLLRFQLVCV